MQNAFTPHPDGVEPLGDRALPHLARALDPAVVGPRLQGLIGDHGAFASRVLKHAPGKRCVIAYTFADGTRVVAKLYRRDRAAAHAAVLAELAEALRGDVRTPRPLALWDDLGAVVQDWVPGDPVPDFEKLGGRADLVTRLGAALADLHASPVTSGRPAELAALVRKTCHPGPAALASQLPVAAAAARALAADLDRAERRLARSVRPSHGDFAPRQVFVHGPRVWLVDLDGFCQADPALDVANFRVGLEAHLEAAGRELADRFLAAYGAQCGIAALPGLATYEAFAWLRRAFILWRKRPADWEAELERCLERGRARLDGAGLAS